MAAIYSNGPYGGNRWNILGFERDAREGLDKR
jgi:hypothetical protein